MNKDNFKRNFVIGLAALATCSLHATDTDGDGVSDEIENLIGYSAGTADTFDFSSDSQGNQQYSNNFEGYSHNDVLNGSLSDPLDGSSTPWSADSRFLVKQNNGIRGVRLKESNAPGEVIYAGANFGAELSSGEPATHAWVELKFATTPRPLSQPEDIPQPAAAVISVNENGELAAFDGNTNQWVVDTSTVLNVDSFKEYVDLRIFLDYVTKQYNVYVGGVLTFKQLGFLSPELERFQAVSINAENEGHIIEFDDLKVTFSETGNGQFTADYEEWATENFTDAQRPEAKPTVNTDGDALDLWLEFILGGNPAVADNDKLPDFSITPTAGDPVFEFSVTRRSDLSHDFVPEVTDDLASGTWYSGNTYISVMSSVDHGDGTTTDTYQAVSSEFDSGAMFLRWFAK